MNHRQRVVAVIEDALRGISITGKCGIQQLQPLVADRLAAAGFAVDIEDAQQFLRPGMPVWRSKDTGLVEETANRRRVDVVVYSDNAPVALVETESDLNDLKKDGVTKRNGHYDVFSIAKDASGHFYDSYKSLERMAAAAYYWAQSVKTGQYPSASDGPCLLEALTSESQQDHNPARLALVLVSGSCRSVDEAILRRRLESLGADLVCGVMR